MKMLCGSDNLTTSDIKIPKVFYRLTVKTFRKNVSELVRLSDQKGRESIVPIVPIVPEERI